MANIIGTAASVGCLIHCMAAPLVAILLPTLGAFAKNETFEMVSWMIAALSLIIQLKEMPSNWMYLAGATLLCGTLGLLMHFHLALHAAFFAVAGLSLASFTWHHGYTPSAVLKTITRMAAMPRQRTPYMKKMTITIITGSLGAGKTTYFIALLRWMYFQSWQLPPILINDRGTGQNLDFIRIMRSIAEMTGKKVKNLMKEMDAEDLGGKCIGCSGRDEFIATVRQLIAKGCTQLMVEPSGMFELEELDEIATELPECQFTAVHLLPQTRIDEEIRLTADNLRHARVRAIGLTHVKNNASAQMSTIEAATGTKTFIIEEEPDDDIINEIWGLLQAPQRRTLPILGRATGCGHSCGSGCGHVSHSGEHVHEDKTPSLTFSTEGWSATDILAFIVSENDPGLRFKGNVMDNTGEGKILVQWSHGTWSEEPTNRDAELKGDLFSSGELKTPSKADITRTLVERLLGELPPVYRHSPIKGKPGELQPIGGKEWRAKELADNSDDTALKAMVYDILIERCREALTLITSENGESVNLASSQVGMYIMEVIMLLVWLNDEYGKETADDLATAGLGHIADNDVVVNLQALRSGWDDMGQDLLNRLPAVFPDRSEMLKRMAAEY